MASATDLHDIELEARRHRDRRVRPARGVRDRIQRTARLRRSIGLLSVGLGLVPLVGARRLSGWMGSDRVGLVWLGALAVAGIAAFDVARHRLPVRARSASATRDSRRSRSTIVVNREPAELYHAWRDFENLPRFLKQVVSVESTGEGRWRSSVEGPGRRRREYDVEILHEQSGRSIGWRTRSGSRVDRLGHVRFDPAPGDRGTLVTLEIEVMGSSWGLAGAMHRLVGKKAKVSLHEELRRFKRWMEAGEVPTTEGQPSGRMRKQSRREGERP